MNEVKEKININEIIKNCRVFDPKETLAQLRGINPRKFVCWGATKFTIDSNLNPKMLRFYVTGLKHKGHVYIFLNGLDLYNVYITTIMGTIVHKSDEMGLYFDQFTDWIDDKIEKQPYYKF